MITVSNRFRRAAALAVGAAVVGLCVAPPAVASQDDAILKVTVLGPDHQRVPGAFVENEAAHFAGSTDSRGVLVKAADPRLTNFVCASLDADNPLGGETGWIPGCADTHLTAGKTTAVTVVMAVGAAFSGRMTDARTGAPVAGATVQWTVGDLDFPTAATDADGVYVFRSVPPAYTVDPEILFGYGNASSTARWGYRVWRSPTSGEYPLHAGVVTTGPGLDMSVVPNVRVRGTVTDAGGHAVPGARVSIRVDDSTTGTTATNAQGGYLFVVPWDSTGPVCAKAAPNATYPVGLARQCRGGLFRHGIEARADFTLTPPA